MQSRPRANHVVRGPAVTDMIGREASMNSSTINTVLTLSSLLPLTDALLSFPLAPRSRSTLYSVRCWRVVILEKSPRTLRSRSLPASRLIHLARFHPRLYLQAFASTLQVHYILLVIIRTRALMDCQDLGATTKLKELIP